MTSSSRSPSARALALLSALVGVSACTSRLPGEETDSDGGSTATDGTTTQGPTTSPPPTTQGTDGPTTGAPTTGDPTTGGPGAFPVVRIAFSDQADILFVIDNSASMGEQQAKLAERIPNFVQGLEGLRWRIGITTTDSGNPRCAADTTPERGALVLSSCLDRVAAGEFEIEGLGEDAAFACTDFCQLGDAELAIKPTATHLSNGELAPREWIEGGFGLSNVPDDVPVEQALRCFVPQGIAGCGFESHLESMFQALGRTEDPNSPTNHGFLRPEASLSVIFVSDETDCSPRVDEIFTTNKVYWNDPADTTPTSAVCWRAGVTCDGAGPLFTDCFADDHDVAGNGGAAEGDGVLQPLPRYVDFLQAIEDQKQKIDPLAEVRVMMIGGVPIGYDTHDAELVFEDAADPGFQAAFGIGPGCVAGEVAAVPPVREREVAEAFAVGDTRDVFSICADDFGASLAGMAERIAAQLRPACMPECVADIDPQTPTLEPNCQVFEVNLATEARLEIAPCVEVNGQWTAPAGATVCFAPLVDKSGETPSGLDDMSQACVAEGFNLEFLVLRTAAPPPNMVLEATCALSMDPAGDCPLL